MQPPRQRFSWVGIWTTQRWNVSHWPDSSANGGQCQTPSRFESIPIGHDRYLSRTGEMRSDVFNKRLKVPMSVGRSAVAKGTLAMIAKAKVHFMEGCVLVSVGQPLATSGPRGLVPIVTGVGVEKASYTGRRILWRPSLVTSTLVTSRPWCDQEKQTPRPRATLMPFGTGMVHPTWWLAEATTAEADSPIGQWGHSFVTGQIDAAWLIPKQHGRHGILEDP
ncbi:hypothetical protein NUW58_g2818 [Xylaria curta]|uniref:Uncharacterized protein n=1 Tax=Xylaria curta TaxID=42375 RepID=A0ACC1PG65_9PEZI|nr:hypothetical protein NUW58_g2818 [Xylaria curta]